MPCYLITLHAYGSWMPDRARVYVRRHQGVLPPDPVMAERYRRAARGQQVVFTRQVQQLMIQEVLRACSCQGFDLHMIAGDPTHLHLLCSWRTRQTALLRRRQIKMSLSRCLNQHLASRTWFARGGSVKRVGDREHFDHLCRTYLPRHRGLKWRPDCGIYE